MFHALSATIIAVSTLVAGLGAPISLFELSQPGHTVNKYYWKLHPSALELAQQDLTSTPTVLESPRSEIAEAPIIVVPTAEIFGFPPQ